MEVSNFKASCNPGDLISLIPAMNKYYRLFGKRIVLYLWKNRGAFYYHGAKHSTVNEEGNSVMLNEKMIEIITPLLLAQPCIESVKEYKGEEIKVDFDNLYVVPVSKPYGSLGRWIFHVYPNLSTDLSGVWLNVPAELEMDYAKDKIVIARTERYTNQMINYFFLKEFQDECIFVGLPHEHEKFCKEFELEIKFQPTENFLILAQVIKQCKFFMSNQTAAFQIAEGLKKPRILEICSAVPNVHPIGENAYDFLYQTGLEYYFKVLNESNL